MAKAKAKTKSTGADRAGFELARQQLEQKRQEEDKSRLGGRFAPEQRAGGIEGIAQSLLDPFSKLAAFGGESVRKGKFTAAGLDASEFKPSTLTAQEFENFIQNPFREVTKAGVGAASLLAPGAGAFGGGVSGLLKAGAIGGAGAGFGASQPGEELEGIITGGATGAAVGGGIAGLGALGRAAGIGGGRVGKEVLEEGAGALRGARRLGVEELAEVPAGFGGTFRGAAEEVAEAPTGFFGRRGRALRRSATGSTSDGTPGGFFGSQKAADRGIGVLDEFKQPVSSKGVNVSFNRLKTAFNKEIKGSRVVVQGSEIIDDAVVRVGQEVDNITTGAAGRVRKTLEAKLSNTKTIQDLSKFKFDLQGKMNPIFKKLNTGNPLTDTEQMRLAFRNAADDALKTLVPKTGGLLDDMSALHTVASDITKEGARGFAAKPFGIPINVSGTAQKARQATGRVLEGKLPSVPGTGTLGRAAGELAEQPAVQRAGQLAGQLAPRVAAQQAVAPAETGQPDQAALEALLTGGQEPTQLGAPGGGQSAAQSFALQALLAGVEPKRIKEIQELLSLGEEEEVKLTEQQRKFAGAKSVAEEALALLESGKITTGKVAGIRSGVEKFLGTQSADVTAFQSKLASSKTLLKNALLGSAMTPTEQASLRDSIPNFNDEPKIMKQKLKTFIEAVETFSSV